MNDSEPVTTLDELYEYLKRFSLSDSLLVISVVNSALRYGFVNIQTEAIPEGAVRWIQETCPEPRNRAELFMQLTRIARFLLLSRANDFKEPILDTGSKEMQHALFMVATLYEKEVEGEIKSEKDLITTLGRLAQWQFPLQAQPQVIMGRGHLLFNEIPAQLKTAYDFEQKMKEHYGLGVFAFMASGLAQWMMSHGVLKYKLDIEIGAIKEIVTKETLQRFVNLSSGTPEDYRRYIRGEEWRTPNKLLDIYSLDPFLCMPAIRVERSGKLEPGQYVVPQPLYLLQRASLGTFYLLETKEKELAVAAGNKGQNYFREAFGQVFREYIKKQLALASEGTVSVDLDEDVTVKCRKPDFALTSGDTCILFEVKTSLLSLNQRTTFDSQLAREEITRGNFQKALGQLNDFESAITSGNVPDDRFIGIKNVVKVIVGFEDMYMANPFLLPIAKDVYQNTADNLQIASLTDIETIGTRLAQKKEVVKIIWEKIRDQRAFNEPLGPYLVNKSPAKNDNPLLIKAFEDFLSRVAGKDYTNAVFSEETE